MTEKLRKQLDQIDEWLTEEGGAQLWDVLTALRGPDNSEDRYLKFLTTNHIRTTAFPKLAQQYWHGDAHFGTAAQRVHLTVHGEFPSTTNTDVSHFGVHITNAARALTK